MIMPSKEAAATDFSLVSADGTELRVVRDDSGSFSHVEVIHKNRVVLQSPYEELWSVAGGWQDQWPSHWHHVAPEVVRRSGAWLVISGESDSWLFQDSLSHF
jgi:hypothetical protein